MVYECEICDEYSIKLYKVNTDDSNTHIITKDGIINHIDLNNKLVCLDCSIKLNLPVNITKIY